MFNNNPDPTHTTDGLEIVVKYRDTAEPCPPHAAAYLYADEWGSNPLEWSDWRLMEFDEALHMASLEPGTSAVNDARRIAYALTRDLNRLHLVRVVYKYEHSGSKYSLTPFSCQWDSGVYGFAIYEAERGARYDRTYRRELYSDLQEVLDQYTAWANGDVWQVELITNTGDDVPADVGTIYGWPDLDRLAVEVAYNYDGQLIGIYPDEADAREAMEHGSICEQEARPGYFEYAHAIYKGGGLVAIVTASEDAEWECIHGTGAGAYDLMIFDENGECIDDERAGLELSLHAMRHLACHRLLTAMHHRAEAARVGA